MKCHPRKIKLIIIIIIVMHTQCSGISYDCQSTLWYLLMVVFFCCISTVRWGFPRILSFSTNTYLPLACKSIRFSTLFATRDVLRGWTSATQLQKLYTDDPIQCLHNKSSSHGVLNTNSSSFTYPLVDFGKVLCSSANELQQNSNAFLEKTIFHKYWLFC